MQTKTDLTNHIADALNIHTDEATEVHDALRAAGHITYDDRGGHLDESVDLVEFAASQQPTTAQHVAREMGDDGSRWSAPDGRSLQQVCRNHGANAWRRESGDRRYEFRDGSAIVVLGGAWDIKHDDCDCGWCWPETDSESLCRSGEYATREWMLTSDTLDAEDAEHDEDRSNA